MATLEPPRTPGTEKDYLRRYAQLRGAWAKHGNQLTVGAFAKHLIDVIRPTLSANSWRQYRAAVSFGLEHERERRPELTAQIDAALELLHSARPCPPTDGALRTSQQKAKRLPPDDLEKICRHAEASNSALGEDLADFLVASDLTGLRPCEWARAELRLNGPRQDVWTLVVVSAKQTHGRSHGPSRTLHFEKFPALMRDTLRRWMATAHAASLAGTFPSLLRQLSDLMRSICKQIFPRRKRRPTMYTPRHAANARWKAFYVNRANTPEERELGRAIVAALLGHKTDETASKHYARPARGSTGSGNLPVPRPEPEEVARVRRRFTLKIESFQARRSSSLYPKPSP